MDIINSNKRGENMKVYSTEEKPLPVGRRILVYTIGTKPSGWFIDEFTISGPSDHYQLNGTYYPHNISHWAELPHELINNL